MPRHVALVPAAGSGTRFAANLPKQYVPLLGRPVLFHSLRALLATPIEQVFVLLAPDDTIWQRFDWSELGSRVQPLYCGGETRAETVLAGLSVAAKQLRANDWVLVHDAARPCLSAELLQRLISSLSGDDVGGLLAVPVADTIKRADGWQRVQSTEPRESLWQAQTPQMFRFDVLKRALESAPAGVATDEAWAVERLDLKPRLVKSDLSNLKITYPDDLRLAELILRMPRASQDDQSASVLMAGEVK